MQDNLGYPLWVPGEKFRFPWKTNHLLTLWHSKQSQNRNLMILTISNTNPILKINPSKDNINDKDNLQWNIEMGYAPALFSLSQPNNQIEENIMKSLNWNSHWNTDIPSFSSSIFEMLSLKFVLTFWRGKAHHGFLFKNLGLRSALVSLWFWDSLSHPLWVLV